MDLTPPDARVQLGYSSPPMEGRWGKGILSPLPGAVVSSAGLGPVLWIGWRAIRDVLTGQAFDGNFYSGSTSGPNPASIYIGFVIVTILIGIAMPCTLAARHLCCRSTRDGYWAFCIPTAMTSLSLAAFLVLPLYWTILYMGMGLTAMRLGGLVYGGVLGLLLAGVTVWAVWPPRRA